MTTIDERGRAVAATLRHAMAEDFDVEGGLAQVRAELALVELAEPESIRRRWMFAAAAAITVGLVGAGVLAVREREPVDVTDTTTAPALPTSTNVTPSTTVAATSTTVGTSTTAANIGKTVIVADVVETSAPAGELVATLGFGGGPGQLAVESCQECEPARPWAPARLPDGRVLIADTANGRWVVIEPATTGAADPASLQTTEVPWPEGITVREQPMVDDAGTVYAVMGGDFGEGEGQSARLWVMSPDDLAQPLSQHGMSLIGGLRVELTPSEVRVDATAIPGLVPVLKDRPTVDLEYNVGDPASGQDLLTLRVMWRGIEKAFEYGAVSASLFGPQPTLPIGSVITFVLIDGQEFADRLTPEGHVLRIALPPVGSVFGSGWVDMEGLLRLELSDDGSQWNLVRYDLP